MDDLRLILLALGVVLIAGIYGWDRLRRRRPSRRSRALDDEPILSSGEAVEDAGADSWTDRLDEVDAGEPLSLGDLDALLAEDGPPEKAVRDAAPPAQPQEKPPKAGTPKLMTSTRSGSSSLASRLWSRLASVSSSPTWSAAMKESPSTRTR